MEQLKQYLNRGEKADFAKKIGTSPSYLSQILSGHRRPSLEMMARIQEATGGAVDFNSWSPANAPSEGAS